MEWGVSGGWADEALADYPKLPKSFTNAKTAKKRKHKELFVTEEDLLKPVRLPHVLAAHKGGCWAACVGLCLQSSVCRVHANTRLNCMHIATTNR